MQHERRLRLTVQQAEVVVVVVAVVALQIGDHIALLARKRGQERLALRSRCSRWQRSSVAALRLRSHNVRRSCWGSLEWVSLL